MEQFILPKEKSEELIAIIKKYTNLFKALYIINPSAAAEFRKKQEQYYQIKHSDHVHHKGDMQSSNSCCSNKLDSKSI
jgi:hypothetical protein